MQVPLTAFERFSIYRRPVLKGHNKTNAAFGPLRETSGLHDFSKCSIQIFPASGKKNYCGDSVSELSRILCTTRIARGSSRTRDKPTFAEGPLASSCAPWCFRTSDRKWQLSPSRLELNLQLSNARPKVIPNPIEFNEASSFCRIGAEYYPPRLQALDTLKPAHDSKELSYALEANQESNLGRLWASQKRMGLQSPGFQATERTSLGSESCISRPPASPTREA